MITVSDGFQEVARWKQVLVMTVTLQETGSPYWKMRFMMSIILTGAILIRHQDEFCNKGPRRKHVCFPGKKIEDITERTED